MLHIDLYIKKNISRAAWIVNFAELVWKLSEYWDITPVDICVIV